MPCMDTLSMGSKQYMPFFRAAVPNILFFFFQKGKGKAKIRYKAVESQGFCVSPQNSEMGTSV